MKSGHASRWAAREFAHESKSGTLRFIDWLDFEQEFRKDFTLLDTEAAAVNMLETTAYFQGKRTVDDYLDQFRDLIYDSGYADSKTIVVKFRRGLDRQIATALAGMASSRPSDTDPDAWFKLMVQMDQNHTADEAFQASHRQTRPLVPSCNVPLHHAAVPWRGDLFSGPPGPSIRFSGQTLGMHQYLYDTIYLLSPFGFIIICLVPISRIIPLRAIVS